MLLYDFRYCRKVNELFAFAYSCLFFISLKLCKMIGVSLSFL